MLKYSYKYFRGICNFPKLYLILKLTIMKKFLALALTVVFALLFSSVGAINSKVSLIKTDTSQVDEIDINKFMKEVALTYNANRRISAHLATATFEAFGKVNGHYAQYTISSGHIIYKGEDANVAKMALYSYLPEKINKSWRRHQWLENSKRFRKQTTDLPMNGGVGLNSYQYFELVGPLSSYSEKYNYQLKDVEWIGEEMVYRIRFNTKAIFSLASRFTKGYLLVEASTMKVINVDVTGELLWSTMFHERVFGTMHFELVYYNSQPFISKISTRYEKKKVEERTLLKVTLQKFNSLSVNSQSALDLQLFEINPLVVPDKNLAKSSAMNVNFIELQNDLGYEESLWEQYQERGGKLYWEYNDKNRSENSRGKENAVRLVEEYRMLFIAF